nr:hypothetical protein [Tanacetum cinerariifolium]
VVKRALFRSGMYVSGILSLPEVDGIEEDILAATRYPNGGGVAAVSPSSKGYVSSEAETELYRAEAGKVRARCSSSSSSLS